MEKPRLSRQTSVSCLLAAAAFLCSAVVAAPAQAATSHQSGHHRHGARPARQPRRPAVAAPRTAGAVRRAGADLPAPVVLDAPGFDTCWAPSAAAMQAWHNTTGYRAVGIYIGGRNRACVGGNLTPSWVRAVANQGWSYFPVYVGLQAPCVIGKGMTRMQAAQAGAEGTAEADDAAAQARAYGLAEGSPIYFDLEAYKSTDAGCVATVLSYLNAWTIRLHADGFYSGVYGSADSGMTALATAVQSRSAFTAPDEIWIAHWDQQANTTDSSVPDQLWAGQQRIKQYVGGHVEKHGGVAIDIDSDWVDGPVARLQ